MGGENIFLDRIDIYKTGKIKEIVVAGPGKDFRNKFCSVISAVLSISQMPYIYRASLEFLAKTINIQISRNQHAFLVKA